MIPKHTPKDPIAQSLLTSAENLSPSYSEHLHQRTMRAIRAQQTRMTIEPRSSWNHAITAIAAILLLCLSLWYFTSSRQSPVSPRIPAPGQFARVDLNIPDAGDLIRHGSQPLRDALSGIDGKALAQLEQDARSLARFIANQLPQSDPRYPAKPIQQKAQPGT